ncbi:MAG: hypothetical protein V8R08_00720 [Coriobacteriales bacterium]
MFELVVHPHALKHGIAEEDILYAWENFIARQRRAAPREDQTIAIGCDRKGALMELAGIDKPYGTLIYHAFAPPTDSVLRELGLRRGKR